MFKYKIDVMKSLSDHGFTSSRNEKRKDSERGNNAKFKKRKRNNDRHIEYNMYYIKMSAVGCSGNSANKWRKNKYF